MRINHLRVVNSNNPKDQNDLFKQMFTNETFAFQEIMEYCHAYSKYIPFSFVKGGKQYSKTGDFFKMSSKHYKNFPQMRTYHSEFFLELGSMRLEDTSMRREVLSDWRLLVTWLHNPISTGVIMMANDPKFKKFLGIDAKTNYSGLIKIYKNMNPNFDKGYKQLKLAI